MNINFEEGQELDFDEIMEKIEEQQEEEKIKVTAVGNQMIRVACGGDYVVGKIRMKHGDIIEAGKLSAAKSVVYTDEEDKIEAKLSNESVHLFIQERCLTEWNLDEKLTRKNIIDSTTHSRVLNAFSECVGKLNGIFSTRAEIEKKKKKKQQK